MAIIPTNYGGNVDSNTGAVAPRISFAGPDAQASAARSISGGLSDIAHGIAAQANNQQRIQAQLQQRQEYNDHLWSEGKYTEAQRKWIQWTSDVQKNGSEDVVKQFQEGFSTYREQALAAAPNKGARDRLALKLDDLGTQVFQNSLSIEATNRSNNTVDTFGTMLADSGDIIAQAPELYATQQARLSETLKISVEQGRIDKGIAAKMQDHINSLAANAAEAMISRNPERARQILDSAKGIDWQRRKSIGNEIDRAMESNTTLFRYQQESLFKSTIDSLSETGKAPDSFNVEQYASAFPAKSQDAVRVDALAKIETAKTIFVGKSELQGQTVAGINAVLEKYSPKEGAADYAHQSEAYQQIAKVADHQLKLQKSDPFVYSRQDPIVDGAWKLVESLPEDTTPELRAQLVSQAMDSSVNFQKSLGIPDGKLSVMSNSQAIGLASKINNGSLQEVQQSFQQMQQSFGKYYANAFRDLARLPDGQRIDGAMQIVALHLGQPFLSDFVQAIRTPDSDLKILPDDAKTIKENLSTDANFSAFSSALVSANPAAVSYVDDFNRAISKYATSLLFRGKAESAKEAVKKSTDLIIGSAYAFTEVGGSSIAIKRTQDKAQITDEDVPKIRTQLDRAVIDSSKIDLRQFVFPQNLSEDTKKQSIRDTLANDTFWVTNPQNDGVTMFMNGAEGTAAPVRYKTGEKVEMKFTDLIAKHNSESKALSDTLRANLTKYPDPGMFMQ